MQVFDIEDVLPFQHTAARRRLVHRRAVPPPTCQVSTHSRPKAAGSMYSLAAPSFGFQHTAARRRLVACVWMGIVWQRFQHTAARRRLVLLHTLYFDLRSVSTHSRPKAAGRLRLFLTFGMASFNTQPPEGGWADKVLRPNCRRCFNTQPPEGGWCRFMMAARISAGFNTQPPEGGWSLYQWSQSG